MNSLLMVLALLAQEEASVKRVLAELPANGSVVLAGQPVPWAGVTASLKKHAESGIRQLVLRVDGSVPFSSVQTLMSAAREAGLEGVQFSSDTPVAPLKISDDAHRLIRIKVREGAKGLELLVLQETGAVSLDDLQKKLKALEKGPVVIDAEVEVPTGAVRQIVAACTAVGFDTVSFAGTNRKTDR